ncbi:MAG: Sec-independent protein translocase protein TatB [Erythrobacter sp.]|jgi:sec-independent protein translocase protein TatB
MFDVGASELLVIVVVAILVIGPKDMPRAMRTAGRWIGKARRMSNHFRAGIDEMIRQAEIEDMEAKWADRNKQIMAKYPTGDEPAGGAPGDLLPPQMEPLDPVQADAAAEAAIRRAAPVKAPEHAREGDGEPPLPLDPPPAAKDA